VSINPNPEFASSSSGFSVWSDGEISVGSIKASSSSPSRKFNHSNITIGADKMYKENNLIGFALSVGREDTDIGTDGSNVQSDNIGISLYTTYKLNQVSQIEASIGFSDLNLDNKRIDENETLTGKRNGQLYTGSIRLRKFIHFNGMDYSFYSGINFTDIKLEKYDEAGGNKALRYFDQDNDYKELDLGIQISKLNDYKDYKIRTYTDLHYSRFLNKISPASMRYLSQSNIYSVEVANEFKANTTIKLGINAWKSEDLKIDFSVSRMESVHNNDNDIYVNSVNFGIRYTF